jgi:hypothetical protein
MQQLRACLIIARDITQDQSVNVQHRCRRQGRHTMQQLRVCLMICMSSNAFLFSRSLPMCMVWMLGP